MREQFDFNRGAIKPMQYAKQRSCYKCGYESRADLRQCPRCRQRLRTSGEIRGIGVVLLLIGFFLTAVGGSLFVFVGFLVAQAGQPGSGVRIPAEERDGIIFLFMFGIFVLLVALGLTATAAGIWQILFARRSKFLGYLFIGLTVLTFAVGSIITVLID